MADNNYDLRSKGDAAQQSDPEPVLPGQGGDLGGGGFVNMTPLKSLLEGKKPQLGCHPRRLIDEIIHKRFASNKSFRPYRYSNFFDYNTLNHEHRLVFNGNQSSVIDNKKVISSLCLDCHYHFVFTMTCDLEHAHEQCSEDRASWPLPEHANPWHHLIWAREEDHEIIEQEANKYHPLVARHFFACVAPPCTFELMVDVSEPRLDMNEQNLLMDHERILEQLAKAREQDPARYVTATDDWAKQAPRNLNTYLKNMLDDQPKRSISKRNKRFAAVFGPRSFDLFRRLEFEEVISEREDGEDEGTFTPPNLQAATSGETPDPEVLVEASAKEPDVETQIGTYRAFIEDVRAEVQSLIHRMGDSDEQPSFIHRVLHKNMGCSSAELKDRVFVDLDRYRILGVLPEQSKEAVVNAYYRQWSRMAGSQKELIECLKQVANDLSDERLTDYATMQATLFESFADVQGGQETSPLEAFGDLRMPVGLSNIGNTCYLNSLLQYLYTVRGVREVVNNFNKYRLELDDEQIAERKIGGNKMTMIRGEAVVAQAFVQEMATLFYGLSTSDKKATQPTQRLANAVLLPTRSVLDDADAEIKKQKEVAQSAPPVPPRPTSTSVHAAEPELTNDTSSSSSSPSIHKKEVATSDDSSGITLGGNDLDNTLSYSPTQEASTKASSAEADDNQRDSTDVPMLDIGPQEEEANTMTAVQEVPQPSIDETVLRALETQKRSSGTEQQDVEEVIGSIVNLLQSAIRPDREDPDTGIQYEKMMETFFITTVNYTKKFRETTYQSEVSYDRSITAFPSPDGPSHLHDCLASNFDQQVLEGSELARYSAIRTPPPILHVLIQRTQSNFQKNENPVIIPETLYLDRYMEVEYDTVEFKRRKKQWALSSRLKDLKQGASTGDGAENSNKLADNKLGEFLESLAPDDDASMTDSAVELGAENDDWSFDGAVEDPSGGLPDDAQREPATAEKSAEQDAADKKKQLEDFSWEMYQATDDAIEEMRSNEWTKCEQAMTETTEATKTYGYRLEAVICHKGRLSAGHYWVWIRDFEDQVWRCYNDSNVREEMNEDEVFKQLNERGDPYYLCYVRDEDKQNWVSVPKRHPETA